MLQNSAKSLHRETRLVHGERGVRIRFTSREFEKTVDRLVVDNKFVPASPRNRRESSPWLPSASLGIQNCVNAAKDNRAHGCPLFLGQGLESGMELVWNVESYSHGDLFLFFGDESLNLRRNDLVGQVWGDHSEVSDIPSVDSLGPYLPGAGKVDCIIDDAAAKAQAGGAAQCFHIFIG